MTTTNKAVNITNDIPETVRGKLEKLPKKPGIYQYFNSNRKIIYIGKAVNLRNRVRSYFVHKKHTDAKTSALLKNIADLEYIVTDSEAEALILEDTLIKQHKPKYNILLKDDKSYPFVRITNEDYPRIFLTRNITKDGSKFIGPFTEVRNIKQVMRLIRNLFYIRSCDLNITDDTIKNKKHKVCLDYHIKKCEGPCEGLVSREHYRLGVKSAVAIINGKTAELTKSLKEQMNFLSEQMRFEEAAVVRNRLQALQSYTENQKIVTVDEIDRDVIGLSRIDDSACTLILKIRDGKLIGKRHFIIKDTLNWSDSEVIQTTLEKWYLENEFVPKEIYLPVLPDQSEFLLDWLKQKRRKSLEFLVPKAGDKKKLVTMASLNADFILREYHLELTKREQTASKSVLSLQRDLRLKKPPLRIECFDNSHIQGSDYVSSMVVFIDGKPKKSEYRKYKIKTFTGNDDFAAMREVISRRYSKIETNPLPDLIIIDGGKGQLSSAASILKEFNLLDKVVIIGLAKRLEEVFLVGQSESLMLPKTSGSLRLIQHLRDEAHRFAITFHKELRKKRTIKTSLTDIEGVGEKTAKKLLTEFGSIKRIKNLSVEDLTRIVSSKTANSIFNYFNEKVNEESDDT